MNSAIGYYFYTHRRCTSLEKKNERSYGKIKTPIWFWIAAIFFYSLEYNGSFSFFVHTFVSEEALAKLPEQERELYGDYPIWTTIVFAIAVFGGLLGSLELLLKKKWSKLVLSFHYVL
ncbi:MAG: hypothetical protein ABFR32_03585 [Bacteroidota bacterium]